MGADDSREIGSNTETAAGARTEPGAENTQPAANSGAGTRAGATTPAPAKRSHKKKPVVQPDLVAQQPEIVNVNLPDLSDQPAAPKRSHKKKPPVPVDLSQLESNIEMVGEAAFGMIGLATNAPHIWAVAPEEMQRISRPAARIIDRAGQLETTNKYADYVMILGAAALIVIPRLIAMKMEKQAQQPKIPMEVKTDGTAPNRSNRDIDGSAANPIPGNRQNPLDALYEIN
jgi:hypothetical protein